MNGLADHIVLFGAEILGDGDGSSGGQAGEEAHEQVDQSAGGTAHGSQSFRSHKLAHHDGVHCVVKLLEKGPEQNREKEKKKLLPDNSFRDTVPVYGICCILLSSHNLSPQELLIESAYIIFIFPPFVKHH